MKEQDIRPKELFQTYLELSRRDAEAFDRQALQPVSCVACGADSAELYIEKHGFRYNRCSDCGTVYCSPRPTPEMLDRFYRNSASANYWSTVFLPAVAEARRTHLFSAKARQIRDAAVEHGCALDTFCDIGAGYGMLLQEVQALCPDTRFYAIEPGSSSAARCRGLGFETLEATVEDSAEWAGRFGFVTSQEVIEHVHSPLAFARALHDLLTPGGTCLVTTLGCEGFDILTLREHSQSIYAPHHLNFMSLRGFKTLMQRAGFSTVDVWTPGKLDVDIVLNNDHCSDFVNVLASRGEEAMADFQALLQKHALSSHTWIMARR